MVNKKLTQILEIYVERFVKEGIPILKNGGIFPHLHWMCLEIYHFHDSIKKQRWLGFIQGVLFSHNWFTLEELKSHNKESEPLIKKREFSQTESQS
jgi:hypothetical protein